MELTYWERWLAEKRAPKPKRSRTRFLGYSDAPRPTPITRSRRKGKPKKYYVVWRGRNPGIYLTWDDCKEEVDCYSGARYRSYRTLSEAQVAFHAEPSLQKND